jgi:hypothetical protein
MRRKSSPFGCQPREIGCHAAIHAYRTDQQAILSPLTPTLPGKVLSHIRVQMQIPRQMRQRRAPSLDPHLLQLLPQNVKHVLARVFRDALELGVGRVGLDHEVDKLAGRGLPAFVHPPARELERRRVGRGREGRKRRERGLGPLAEIRRLVTGKSGRREEKMEDGRLRSCKGPRRRQRRHRLETGRCGRYLLEESVDEVELCCPSREYESMKREEGLLVPATAASRLPESFRIECFSVLSVSSGFGSCSEVERAAAVPIQPASADHR